MTSNVELQQRVTRLLLTAIAADGFALAGAGAIRAHGLTDRPTADIDLFCSPTVEESAFREAVDRGHEILHEAGYATVRVRDAATFSRLRIHTADGMTLDVDFAINWRAATPVLLSVGPVIAERDAVAGKLGAAYSRGEVRDFLDLDAIRRSGRYTDEELLTLGHEHDAGFDPGMFAAQLSHVLRLDADQVEEYGVTTDELAAIQQRLFDWALRLRDEKKG